MIELTKEEYEAMKMNLKDYMDNKNISIYKLSKDTGIAYTTVADYVHQRSEMPFTNAIKIAHTLEITLDELAVLITSRVGL